MRGESLRFWTVVCFIKEHAQLFSLSLSLLLSSGICRALRGGERLQREREREREREELLFTRAKAHSFSLSLSFSSVRDFSRLSVFPNGELEEKTRG